MIILPTPDGIAKACQLLEQGQVVGMPTETVYGLAGDAFQDEAVARIFALKNRPTFNPLIIHVASLEAADTLVDVSLEALTLIDMLWPGPLTLVLPRKKDCRVSLLASSGLDTLAIRCPAHPVAGRLIQAYGRPLAAPSANKSMGMSPTCAQDVVGSLGDQVPLILEGGQCEVGLESTILDLTGIRPVLLRPGGVPVEALEALIGPVAMVVGAGDNTIKAPGMMRRHYAPHRTLRLNALDRRPGEALLGFGETSLSVNLNLSEQGDLIQAAANLFRMLRQLDQDPFTAIAVMPIPITGLGLAINDRLQRAAALEEKE
jgi:L-threonylcarbamoyladenylate synthase